MKIGIYTDCHYSSAQLTCGRRYNNKSLEKIKQAYEFFEKSACELVVCLGDLIDTELTVEKEIANLKEIAKVIHNCKIPTVCLMGNHDAFVLEQENFYKILGISCVQEINSDGCKLLFLDACYFKSGKRYAPGDSDWTDTFYPNEQKLKETLANAKEKVYIFIHQNLDAQIKADHRVFNADSLVEIINQSGVVKAVFQGHYHLGHSSEYCGVKYVTLPAMCENDHAFWVYDL